MFRISLSFHVFISAVIVHVTISVGSSKPRQLRTASRANAQDDSRQLMLEATDNHRKWEESMKQSCGEENAFEDVADKLAYHLVRALSANATDVTFVPKLAEGMLSGSQEVTPSKTTAAQTKAAMERLQGWWTAVARVQHQKSAAVKIATHAKSSAAHQNTEEGNGADRFSDGETMDKPITGKVHPPACAWAVPAGDPYWNQKDSYWVCAGAKCTPYNVCEYSDGCKRNFTNAERVHSIRAVLSTTGSLFRKYDVPYLLSGGSAIGAYRCQDVLPWDLDSDVAIPQEAMAYLFKNFMVNAVEGHNGKGRSLDLAVYGFPGFVMMEKFPGCQPLMIVDRSTGFFTDIFPIQSGPNLEHIYTPWWNGKWACDSKTLFNGCEHNRCDVWKMGVIVPLSECKIHTTPHSCAGNLQFFLYESFGQGVEEPDVKTRTATPSARAKALWGQIQMQAHEGAARFAKHAP